MSVLSVGNETIKMWGRDVGCRLWRILQAVDYFAPLPVDKAWTSQKEAVDKASRTTIVGSDVYVVFELAD